jgi:hypothetical protein
MKTIVVLDNIFSADMIKDFDYLKKKLNMEKYNIISPLMFMKKDDKYNMDNFTIRLIASSISLGNMYNEFGTIKAIAKENKTTIYFGMAHQNVKRDQVVVINLPALDSQEFLLDAYLKESNVTFNYIKSGEANLTFNKIEDLVVWLNDLQ